MIPYIEIIGKYTLKPFALIEPSQCWFELSYYEIGEFEIYAAATDYNLQALKGGNYVKIPNKPYLWLIKSVNYSYAADGARMISAKGYEAKWLIGTRIILSPWQIPSNLADADYQLVYKNLGAGASSFRKIIGLTVEKPSFSVTISDTQATRGNLWDYMSALNKANQIGCYSTYDDGAKINFIQGKDVSDSVIFAQSLDNLINSEYTFDSSDYKTYCQIVSTFNQNDQTTEYAAQYPEDDPEPTAGPNVGIDRAEIYLASNISTKYTLVDEEGNPIIDPSTGKPKEGEYSPTSEEYKTLQRQEGKNALSQHKLIKEFKGEIDLRFSAYVFGEDFFIGDLIGIRDETFGYQEKARITKYTFKQDQDGYSEIADYESE